MLNNIRNKFDPFFTKVGSAFASLGFGPGFWTCLGLIFSIISAIMFSLHSPVIGVEWYTATFLGAIFLIIAGFFDAVDGAVARVTGRTSVFGGYIDSVIDKISETIVFVGILIGNLANPVLVLVALSLSIIVSYTRARAETLSVDLKGKGIAERAERILIISILGFIPFQANISVALWIIAILAAVTIFERVKIVSAKHGISILSSETYSNIFKRESGTTYESVPSGSRFNTEPTTSITKVTKNVEDFLDTSDNKNTQKSDTPPKSTSSKPSQTDSQQYDNKPANPNSAKFLDKTDPNETGRNVAQILFEQENEDRKYKATRTDTNTNTGTNNRTDTNTNTGTNNRTDTNTNTGTNNRTGSDTDNEIKERAKKGQDNENSDSKDNIKG